MLLLLLLAVLFLLLLAVLLLLLAVPLLLLFAVLLLLLLNVLLCCYCLLCCCCYCLLCCCCYCMRAVLLLLITASIYAAGASYTNNRGRVDDLSFFEYFSPFRFLLIEFHRTFSTSYKIFLYYVYYYCILIRM